MRFDCCGAFETADVLLIHGLNEGTEQMLALAESVVTCHKEVEAQP